jgi:hypothetical protein
LKSNGYIWVKAPPEFPGSRYRGGKYCLEHHLVWWQNTGIAPQKGQVVHHKNHVRDDNRFENLELMCAKEHKRQHALEIGEAARAARKHGTGTMYRHGKCRCVECRAANAAYSRKQKTAEKEKSQNK